MNCINCNRREATTNDLFCQICAGKLSQEDMQRLRGTLLGQKLLVYKAGIELGQAMKNGWPIEVFFARLLSTLLSIAAKLKVGRGRVRR